MCTSTLHTSYTVIFKLTFSIFHVHSITNPNTLFIFIFIYFSFANEKRNSKANKLSKPGSERRNERLSEGASKKHIQPLTIFHRICENRSNRNFSSVHNFYVFSVILLNQTDSVRFDLIQLDSIEGSDIRKCIHRTHTHPHTHGAGF